MIKQDTTDIKKYILENNATEKAKENEKDLMILNLENKLKSYSYNNKALQDEISILFPEIKNISVASHIFNENTDSTLTKTIVIYKSTKNISSNDKEKLKQWLKKRIAKNNVELYRDKED